MGRNERSLPVSSADMRAYAQALQQLAELHLLYANWMEEKQLGPVEMKYFSSATIGLDKIVVFVKGAAEGLAITASDNDALVSLMSKTSTAAGVSRAQAKRLVKLRDRYYQQMEKASELAEAELKRTSKEHPQQPGVDEFLAEPLPGHDSGQNSGQAPDKPARRNGRKSKA